MKTSERFRELLDGIGEERLAEIDGMLNDPGYAPQQVPLRNDPDPFGRSWDWVPGPEDAGSHRAEMPRSEVRGDRPDGPGVEAPGVVPFRPARMRPRTRRLLWATGVAASFALVACGTWAFLAARRGQLREESIAAWVSHRLVPGADGVGIAAPAEDDERDRSPLRMGADRPVDAKPPAASGIYAPMRIQEQLLVPEVPAGGAMPARPIPTVTEDVRAGSVFYLEFSAASTPTAGTAVVAKLRPGPEHLLWQEVPVDPRDVTGYFGPLKMGDDEAEYLVVVADRAAAPLLSTVARALGSRGGDPLDPDAWKARLSDSLRRAGHEWFAVQRIQVRPLPRAAPAR